MTQGLPNNVLAAIAIIVAATVIALIAMAAQRSRTGEITVDRGRLDTVQKEWRGPPDLVSSSTPRDVRYTGKAYALFALVGVVIGAGVIGAILLYPGIQRDVAQAQLIQREGVAASGTIVDRFVRGGKSNSYHVTYTYDVGGHQYRSTATVPGRVYPALTIGASAPIHYAASQPDVSRADDALNEPPWLRLLVVLPGLVMLIIPAMAMNQKKLLAHGTPAGAMVSRVSPTKGGLAIRYQYLDSSGSVVTGQDVVQSRSAPKVGVVVPIVFDPERPQRCKLYPLALVRLDD